MCSSDVKPEAADLLADLLRDMAAALDPEHPELVVVGPVDFGSDDGTGGSNGTNCYEH